MNIHAICRNGLLVAVLVVTVMLLLPAPTVRAQADEDLPPAGKLELDMYALLLSNRIFPSQVDDYIWTVSPGAGRFLIMVPFKIEPGDRPMELDRRTVKLRGPRARFLTWYFIPDEMDELGPSNARPGGGQSAGQRIAGGLDQRDQMAMELGAGSMRDFSRDTGAARRMGGPGGPGMGGMGGPGMGGMGGPGMGGMGGPGMGGMGGPGMGGMGGPGGGGMSGGPPALSGPQSYEHLKQKPRVTTDALVTPGGTLQWEIERVIQGGELNANGQLYTMRIDYRLLNEQNPDFQERQQSSAARQSVRGSARGGGMDAGPGGMGGGMPGGAAGGMPGGGARGGATRGGGGMDAGPGGMGGATPGGRFGGGTPQGRTGGNNSAEQRAAERAQQEMERIQRQLAREEFQNLREEVRNLPDEFEEPMPRRVWAVFELSQTATEFEIESDAYPNINWSIDFQKLGTLRELAQNGVQAQQDQQGNVMLGSYAQQQFIQLGELANKNHPYSQRAVAHVLDLAQLAYYTNMGDQLFFIFQTLLESPDAETRKITQQELIQTFPPNQATRTLLQQVAESSLDPMEKLGAIRTVIESGAQNIASNPAQAQQTINATNQVLADPNGPPPPAILQAMVNGVRDQPLAIDPLVQGIQFHRLTDERLHQCLVFIVENAGKEPLAAEWLDEKFLSATDPQFVKRALEVIVDAEAGAQSLGPAITWSLVTVLGAPANAEPAVKAKIAYKIPVDNLQHGLLRALRHGDPDIRVLAWQALPKFMMPPRPVYEDEQSYEVVDKDRYQVLLDAALEQSPTPTQIVPFLAGQPAAIRRDLADQRNQQRRDGRSTASRRGNQPQRGGMMPGMDPGMMGPGMGGPGMAGMGGPAMMDGPGMMMAPGAQQRGGQGQDGFSNRRLRTFAEGEEHPDVLRAVSSLVQIALRGSANASNAATRAMIGSEWPIDRALMDLEFGERQGFAMRTYDNLTGMVPWVTYTLRRRVDRNPVVNWFGQELASGSLPDPSLWVNAFGGESELIELATATDGELAKGAIAVLVASAGGADRKAQDLYTRVRALGAPTAEQVKELWQTERRDIFVQRARRMEGTYRLVLRTGPLSEQVAAPTARRDAGGPAMAGTGGPGAMAPDAPGMMPPGGGPGMMMPPGGPGGLGAMAMPGSIGSTDQPRPQAVELPDHFGQEIVLGQIQLRVSGQDVGFGNDNLAVKLHEQVFALVMDAPAELANFDNDAVKDLPLEDATGPAILMPQPDGTWHGAFNLPEMGVYIFLEPATDA
jgi:hypothetical protein